MLLRQTHKYIKYEFDNKQQQHQKKNVADLTQQEEDNIAHECISFEYLYENIML